MSDFDRREDEHRSVELCLYRDGKPLSATAFYFVPYWDVDAQYAISLYPLGDSPHLCWSARFRVGPELTPHWRTLTVEILDTTGCPVASPRPALLYTLPWAVPTVVAFPHRWDGDGGPMVLTMRVDGGITPENRHDDTTAGAVLSHQPVTP